MKLHPFIADSAPDAIRQIRSVLGPDAVVVNVRQIPSQGLARLWQKPRIEVLAYAPVPVPVPAAAPASSAPPLPAPPLSSAPHPSRWRIAPLLESAGFLPLSVQRIVDQIESEAGSNPPASLPDELQLAREALEKLWRKPPAAADHSLRPHILIGPSGSGKTTVLCKWLAQLVLMDELPARVWRLDSAVANTADALSIHCDILNVPCERAWRVDPDLSSSANFIDVPGTDWRSPDAVAELGRRLRHYLSPQIHLTLNAAYDPELLLAQVRAFSTLPIDDIILTHLDEELRSSKIFNLVLGTNFSIRFLSAGQNIPGQFSPAVLPRLIARAFAT